jgi:ClpP class serine protease
MRAFDLACSQPWLCTEEALREVLRVALREDLDIAAVEARLGRPLDNTQDVTVRDGIAIVPICGPIFRYANLFTRISGATSTEVLARDITAALDDGAVRGIVLHIDSPGGEATGINELAALIRAGTAKKPITAHVEGLGASAAYWLASACTEIVASSTAALGSIGAVLTVANPEARGPGPSRTIEIVSSQSPRKRADVAQPEGRQQLQQLADDLAAVFIADVASMRGVTVDTALAEFGQGGMFVGQHAVDAGLADRIGTLEGTLARLSRETSASSPGRYSSPAWPALPLPMRRTAMDWKSFFGGLLAAQAELEPTAPAQEAQLSAELETTAPAAPEKEAQDVQLSAELESARRDLAAAQEAQRVQAVAALASRALSARLTLPAEQDALVALATFCAEHGQLSLVEALLSARTPHTLTEEQLPADTKVLVSDPAPAGKKLSSARRQELMKLTDVGKVALTRE